MKYRLSLLNYKQLQNFKFFPISSRLHEYIMFTYWVKTCIIYLAFCLALSSETKTNFSNLPVIIWWTDMLYPRESAVSEIKCSLGNCIASKRQRYQNPNVTIAYLFYGTDFDAQNLPLPREKNHVWALLHEESPMNNFIFSHSVGIKLFNYTSTFSRESHFPLTTQFVPSLNYLIERKPLSTEEKNKYRKNGTAPVLYLQSHCNVASDRDRYVKEFMKHIQVDSFGDCLHNKDLPGHLKSTETYNSEELFSFISRYKFQLAFENAICDDYITEKLFRTLHVGSVPVYKGSPSVKDWMPSNESIIIVDDFNDPLELANFIIKLDENDTLYDQYLLYKKHGVTNVFLKNHLLNRTWGVNDPNVIDFIQGFECYVCDQVQQTPTFSVANKKHMNCHQPNMSLIPKTTTTFNDEWILQNWPETYWFAYDQAKAIELMIINKENNTSNLFKYLSSFKYHN